MRARDFMEERIIPNAPKLTLKHIHDQKMMWKRKLASRAKRKALYPIMYGHGDYHQKEMEALEREKAKLAVERERAELKKKYAEYEALKQKSGETVSKMAMRTVNRRKRCRGPGNPGEPSNLLRLPIILSLTPSD